MHHSCGKFLKLLRELQKIDQEFPLQYAICLTEISLKEGLSLTELAQKTGLALSTVSRIIGALSKHRQKGIAFGLVRVSISAQERRRKELYLTPKGRAIIQTITDIMAT
jgi:DNA-binding MarR family transcriptional regulator